MFHHYSYLELSVGCSKFILMPNYKISSGQLFIVICDRDVYSCIVMWIWIVTVDHYETWIIMKWTISQPLQAGVHTILALASLKRATPWDFTEANSLNKRCQWNLDFSIPVSRDFDCWLLPRRYCWSHGAPVWSTKESFSREENKLSDAR